MDSNQPKRCPWAEGDKKMAAYHDHFWGIPLYNDQSLFGKLCLNSMQAGLRCRTIVYMWEDFEKAFDNFEISRVAAYGADKFEALIERESPIRNGKKIRALINNANQVLKIQAEFGSFSAYLWGFVNEIPIQNHWQSRSEVPRSTPLSEEISKDLKKRGFQFVGPTIIYAFIQSVGLVNDHLITCHCYGGHDVRN